jgi:chromosomal replication initiator protein
MAVLTSGQQSLEYNTVGHMQQTDQLTGISEDLTRIWESVCRKLKAEYGEDIYSSWFSSASLEQISGGVVTVSVATRFLKSWIEAHYRDKMLQFWKDDDDSIWRIDVRVRSATRGKPSAGKDYDAPSDKIIQTNRLANDAAKMKQKAPIDFVKKQPVESLNTSDPLCGSPLDIKLTFDHFVTGDSNRFAHGAAMEVVNRDEPAYNPLYIHGSVGLGKTHLLQAMAWKGRDCGKRVVYLTAERFMFGFVSALKSHSAIAFKEAMRSIDVLIVDDIQFLTGKTINDEFCHMLNALLDGGKQVIVAADRAPVDLSNLDARVRSRLSGGLAVEICGFDLEVRKSILQKRANMLQDEQPPLSIPQPVLERIASYVDTNGRDLDGAFNSLVAQHRLGGREITLEVVENALKDLVRQREPRKVRVEEIQKAVARHYNITRHDLLSSRRTQNIVVPRQVAMYLSKTMTLRSLPEIGRRFGGKDHTTVLHAVRKIETMLEKDSQFAKELETIRNEIES